MLLIYKLAVIGSNFHFIFVATYIESLNTDHLHGTNGIIGQKLDHTCSISIILPCHFEYFIFTSNNIAKKLLFCLSAK